MALFETRLFFMGLLIDNEVYTLTVLKKIDKEPPLLLN